MSNKKINLRTKTWLTKNIHFYGQMNNFEIWLNKECEVLISLMYQL
jgi:DNA-binding transcriptional regulator/RsmH inhibitor MraZ